MHSYLMGKNNLEVVTLGAGCFWCIESIFDSLKGVEDVISGYSGGSTENPTYQEVCTGSTGHAEVIQIRFDPEKISFSEILRVFFAVHDPTTLNKQGGDIGTQYRSAIFFHSEKQKQTAESVMKEIDDANIWGNPIVTEISPFEKFYAAEDYHQEYFMKNPNQPYCAAVIAPKVAKFRRTFLDKLKKRTRAI